MVAALGFEPRPSRLSGERSTGLELGGTEVGDPPGNRTPPGWIWSPACALARESVEVSPGFEPGRPQDRGRDRLPDGCDAIPLNSPRS